MRVKYTRLLFLIILVNIHLSPMESPGLQIIETDTFENGRVEFDEDDTSSNVTEDWDDEFPFSFNTPWIVNESKLPSILCEMRIKREKIWAKFRKKDVKRLKKELKRKFKQAVTDHNADQVKEFEMYHQEIILEAFEDWAPTYRDTYYCSHGDSTYKYYKLRKTVYSDRKDLLQAFLTISDDTELLKLAQNYQTQKIFKPRDEEKKPKKTQKKVDSDTKNCDNDKPISYSLTYANWQGRIKDKKELIKRLKGAIRENNTQVIKEIETSHPKVLYRRLIHCITNIQKVTFISDNGSSYTQDFTDQNKRSLQTVLNAKINPNLLCPYGTFMLYEACDSHRVSFGKILCETPGINMNQKTREGTTALLQFINRCWGIFEKKGQPDFSSNHFTKEEIEKIVQKETSFVEYLIDRGADPNLADKNGTTPLMVASAHSCYTIVKMLLEKRANPHAKDTFGKNALDHYNKCTSGRTLGVNFFYSLYGADRDSRIEKILLEAMDKERE